jgi:hypothetical protein
MCQTLRPGAWSSCDTLPLEKLDSHHILLGFSFPSSNQVFFVCFGGVETGSPLYVGSWLDLALLLTHLPSAEITDLHYHAPLENSSINK